MHANPSPLSVPSNPPSALVQGIPSCQKENKNERQTNKETIQFTIEAQVCHTVHPFAQTALLANAHCNESD